jgi:hypothetical protein
MSKELFGAAVPSNNADHVALLSQELRGLGRVASVSQETVEQGSVELF